MKKAITVLSILVMIMTGCSTTKKIHSESRETKTETKTKENSSVNSQAETNSTSQEYWESKSTKYADTCAVDPGSRITGAAKLGDLIKGDTLLEETDDQILQIFYDKASGKIKGTATEKPDKVSFKYRETEEQKGLFSGTENRKEQTQASASKQVAEKKKEVEKTQDKQVTRSYTTLILCFLSILIVLAIIAFIAWKLKLF